jgi:hypothetical protein
MNLYVCVCVCVCVCAHYNNLESIFIVTELLLTMMLIQYNICVSFVLNLSLKVHIYTFLKLS